MKFFIGIDNGVTGSIAIMDQDGRVLLFSPMPVFSQFSYTKTVSRQRTRIDVSLLRGLIAEAGLKIRTDYGQEVLMKALVERPMINPMRFHASMSAIAALEAVLICLEDFDIPYEYIDSKAWQKLLLPQNIKGSEELKHASSDIGARLFPSVLNSHKDYDGLLIAEYARRMNL